jgi:methyl-accepting chemotaxis protein
MRLGAKIGGGFGIVVIIGLAIGIVGWIGVSMLNSNLNDMTGRILPATEHLLRIKAEFQQFKIIQRTMLDPDLDNAYRIKQLDEVKALRQRYGKMMKEYDEMPHSEEVLKMWDTFNKSLAEWKTDNNRFFEAFTELHKIGILNPVKLQRDLQQFRGDHYKLEAQLQSFMIFGKDFKGGDDSSKCNFGKWLAGFKTNSAKLNEIFAKMRSDHDAFHENVHEIKELLAKGTPADIAKAKKIYTGQLEEHMQNVFKYFRELRAEAENARELYKEMQHIANVTCLKKQEITEADLDKLVEYNLDQAEKAKIAAESASFLAKLLTIIAIVVGILAGVIIAIVVTKSITGPVSKAVDLAAAMASGNMTIRLDVKSNDEIGDMSRALNTTCDQLSKVIGDIQDNAESLAAASEEMSAVSTQLASGSEEMNSQATTIAGATEEMSANIKSVDDAANQMNKNAQSVSTAAGQIAENMNNVASAVEESQSNVASMASASEEMTSTINEIAQNAQKANETTANAVESVNQASTQVGDLANASQEINQIISVIMDIAEQTKLLALNATIEAARAGEAGKGFAVVANEVKDLAKQTNDATEDIKRRVAGMQDSTSSTVEGINNISEVIQEVNNIVSTIAAAVEEQNVTMKENAQNVAQVSEGVQEITRSVAEVNEGVNDISKSIADVAQGADVVARNANEASIGAADVAKNITGVSEASKDTSNGAQQLNITATDLANMANSLQEMMAKFKVDRNQLAAAPKAKTSGKKISAPRSKESAAALPSLDDI